MPTRCVVSSCSNFPQPEKCIALHPIPYFGDDRPEAKKRRRKWVNFVHLKRANWVPSKWSCVCSNHFTKECYSRSLDTTSTPRLLKDEFGVLVYPTVQRVEEETCQEEIGPSTTTTTTTRPMSTWRRKRRVQEIEMASEHQTSKILSIEPKVAPSTKLVEIPHSTTESVEPEVLEREPGVIAIGPKDSQAKVETKTDDCVGCKHLLNQTRISQNKIISLRMALRRRQKEKQKLLRKIKGLQKLKHVKISVETQSESPSMGIDCESSASDSENEEMLIEEEAFVEEEYEQYVPPDESESDSDDSVDGEPAVLLVRDGNLRMEPKYIVFLTQLLALFKFCHYCKAEDPFLDARQSDTMITIKYSCINPNCRKEGIWHSQPAISGAKIPAGSFLLSFATLIAGASISKVMHICKHMGLSTISLATYFKIQRTKLFPTIHIFWKKYQTDLLAKLKVPGRSIDIAGDARHDSMGHNAKYGTYTVYCCSEPSIIHFDLVQKNQAGSSNLMEFNGFKNCLQFLLDQGIDVSTFVSDRHTSIAAFMREHHPDIKHRFDLWHIKKKITKVLTKLSKKKGMEILNGWIQPCTNHLFWSATSTTDGDGRVIHAKFKTFLRHIVNKHDNHPDPIFDKCHHGPNLRPRKYLLDDSPVYEELEKALTNKSLVKGILQVSHEAQTSSLESFHSVVNQFAPKMIYFSHTGMYCRHILASVHFNDNVNREVQKRKDGTSRIRVQYPKFKNGEATVKDIKVTQNFEYVEAIYKTFLDAVKSNNALKNATEDLHKMTPAPMNTMLDKQPRAEALKKRDERKLIKVIGVPPTTPVNMLPTERESPTDQRTIRRCRTCKNPIKGHKNVPDCPKNKKD